MSHSLLVLFVNYCRYKQIAAITVAVSNITQCNYIE